MERINSFYLQPTNIEALASNFSSQGKFKAIILQKFVSESFLNSIRDDLDHVTYERMYNPIKWNYEKTKMPAILEQFFQSDVFRQFASKILGQEMTEIRGEVIRLSWKSYTVMHDDLEQKKGHFMYLDITEQWGNDWGGQIVHYVPPDDYFPISHGYGSLSIVSTAVPMLRFFKYVNNHSRDHNKLIVVCELM